MAEKNKFQKKIKQNSKVRDISSDAEIEKETIEEAKQRLKIRLKEYKFHDPKSYKKALIIAKNTNTKIDYYVGLDLSGYDEKGNLISAPTQQNNIAVVTGAINDQVKDNKEEESKITYQDSPISVRPVLDENQDDDKQKNSKLDAKKSKRKTKSEKIDKKELEKLKNAVAKEINKDSVDKGNSDNPNYNAKITANGIDSVQINLQINADQSGTTKVELDPGDVAGSLASSGEKAGNDATAGAGGGSGNSGDSLTEVNENSEQNAENTTVQEEPEEDEEIDMSEFEGMTEEEMASELDRRKRLKLLKKKYSEDPSKNNNEMGGYRKSLDFSLNHDLKRFKMKPPKIAIILPIVSILVAIAISLTVTFVVLNKETPPPTLVSASLSQQTTHHYVGDIVDLRGLYIEEVYSDNTKKNVQVDSSMISNMSSNISEQLVIKSLNSNTFIEFNHNGKKQRLVIVLNQKSIKEISSFEIYQDDISADSVIKFDNMLVLAKITDLYEDEIGLKRLSPANATFAINGTQLSKTAEGVSLSGISAGTYNLIITFTEGGHQFSASTQIIIS